MKTVTVDAKALLSVLQALLGPPHRIRELQATRSLPDILSEDMHPINQLIADYNAAVEAHNAETKKESAA